MEGTKIKPNLMANVLSILGITAVIIAFIIVLAIISAVFYPQGLIIIGTSLLSLPLILIPLIIGTVSSLIRLAALTYNISQQNEVSIDYSLINSNSKVFRSNQITSIGLSQNFVLKKLNVGNISLGIFGKQNVASQQQNPQEAISPNLDYVDEPDKIFNKLASIIGVELKESLYSIKPFKNISLYYFIFFTIIGFLFLVSNLFVVEQIKIILVAIGLVFLIIASINYISYLKLKKTTYSFTTKSLFIEHDYFFLRTNIVIPLEKITNFKIKENAISKSLFGISHFQIFTGGDKDPILTNVLESKEFAAILSYVVNNKTPKLSKTTISKIKNNISYPATKLKPGKTYFLGSFLNFTFIFVTLSVVVLILNISALLIIVLGLLYLLLLVRIGLKWKNVDYEFYENKIIVRKGIISITKEEVDVKNIKYLRMRRGMLFERMFNEGSIVILTSAGTVLISNIENYENVFNEIFNKALEVQKNNEK